MKIGKIKPAATLVAQFAAGVEVDAIQHEGKMFLPVVGMGDFESTGGKVEDDSVEEVPTKKPANETPAKETPAKETKSEDEDAREYTEDELMEMNVKELTNILKKEFDVDPNDYDGKNTNKKLRGLILDVQEGKTSSDDEDTKDDDSKGGASDELTEKVASILEDFDSGAKNKKKTIASICKLSDDADEDAVADLVDKFEEDADADLDKMAAKIVASFEGDTDKDDEDEEEEKPSKKSPKSKKKKENLVDVDDLEVGDRVSVWWDDDNQEWFDGEVKSIKKGKVTIAYDDDTEEVIDPEVHTKIKRID